jgi:hypothetical protein
MPLFDGIADDEPCALHTYCIRAPHPEPGPKICPMCLRLDFNVLKSAVDKLLAIASARSQMRNGQVRHALMMQYHENRRRRFEDMERNFAEEPKRYTCYVQNPINEGRWWKQRYRPRSLVCSPGPWNRDPNNLCLPCAKAMAEAEPEWYRICWTEKGMYCANVGDRILDPGMEVSEEALRI